MSIKQHLSQQDLALIHQVVAEVVAEQFSRAVAPLEERVPSKDELRALVREVVAEQADAGSSQTRGQKALAGLTDKQGKVFRKIERLGRDAAARQEAQDLLNSLEGNPLTETFTRAFKRALKEREWGLVCRCGAAAAPLWKQDSTCIETGGRMLYSHTDGRSGKSVLHGSHTTFPRVNLTDKPDRRRGGTRKRTSR